MSRLGQERLDKNADILTYIGACIRAKRMDMRLTQKNVADRIGVETGMVSQYEAGKVDIPITRLYAIAEAIETTVERLTAPVPECDLEVFAGYINDRLADPAIALRVASALFDTNVNGFKGRIVKYRSRKRRIIKTKRRIEEQAVKSKPSTHAET